MRRRSWLLSDGHPRKERLPAGWLLDRLSDRMVNEGFERQFQGTYPLSRNGVKIVCVRSINSTRLERRQRLPQSAAWSSSTASCNNRRKRDESGSTGT